MASLRTLNGKIVLQVYSLDNSYKTLLIEPNSTVADVCRSMAEKIGFSDPEDESLCFSLNECLDGVTIGRSLPPDREVLGIMESWFGKPDAKFIFQCKLYTDGMIASKDPKIIHMLFIQAVYNVITGTYPTNDKEAVHLAALQFQAKFGPHNPVTHKPGFLTNTLIEYIPGPHLESGNKTPQQWEELIFHKHAYSTAKDSREGYLALLSRRDYYGAVLFAVRQKYERSFPRKLFLGISRRGIVLLRIPRVYTDSDSMETLAMFPLADIYRWAYKPGVNFYFEIKTEDMEVNPVYTFETPEGKHMSDMLTEYALGLLREMGLNPDGTKRVRNKDKAPAADAVAEPVADPAAPPSGPSATPQVLAASEDTYKSLGGDVGNLASAATRSGVDTAAEATAAVETAAAAAPAPASDEPPLPANWIKCWDEASSDFYFFNTVTGDSVWERDEIPAA